MPIRDGAELPGPVSMRVRDPSGHAGQVIDDAADGVLVRLDDGRQVMLPREALRREGEGEGEYSVHFDLAPPAARPRAAPATVTEGTTIPVSGEELVVERRSRVTGGVRLHKSVSERVAEVDEPIVRERVTVEHVAIGRPVTDGRIPHVREENGVLIVPVLEEVLTVTRQLVLREELHVRRIREEARERQRVPLRREQVEVERFDAADEGQPPA